MKDSFILYTKYAKQISALTMEQRGVLFTAILAHEAGDEEPEMDAITSMAYDFIRTDLEENAAKYERRCRQNAANGSQGGRPRKPEKANGNEKSEKSDRFSEKQKKQTQPKKADNDNDNDNDSDNEKHKNILPDKSADEHLMVAVGAIIDHLNEKAKTKYRRSSRTTIQLIRARMEEKFTVEDFKTVIDKKCDEWLGTEMEKHLNPETLFRPSHFETYLNQKIIKPKSKTTAFHNFPQRSDPENHRLAQLIASSAQNRI